MYLKRMIRCMNCRRYCRDSKKAAAFKSDLWSSRLKGIFLRDRNLRTTRACKTSRDCSWAFVMEKHHIGEAYSIVGLT